MKRSFLRRLLALLLLACLLLCGCEKREPQETEPSEPETTEAPQPTETEPPPPPEDAGISSVRVIAPVILTVTPDEPNADYTVKFTDVDPTGAPEEGRVCTLTILEEGQVLSEQTLTLTGDAEVPVHAEYAFERYMEKTESDLTVQLRYQEELLEAQTLIELQNYPDEVYAQQSGVAYPYLVEVVRNQCVAYVYGLDENGEYTKLVHVFICTTGYWTPLGWFRMGSRKEWYGLFGGVYGQYGTVITGDIMFHSVPFSTTRKDALITFQYNRLGTIASMGCIRYTVRDAKWLYENCPIGTQVHIYDAREEDLPAPRPEAMKLDPDDPRSNWDPTDPDPENPWNQGEA